MSLSNQTIFILSLSDRDTLLVLQILEDWQLSAADLFGWLDFN